MGHYDSCREAHETFELEEKGQRFKKIINAMDDEQAGAFYRGLGELFALTAKMQGTADQHRSLESWRLQVEGKLK